MGAIFRPFTVMRPVPVLAVVQAGGLPGGRGGRREHGDWVWVSQLIGAVPADHPRDQATPPSPAPRCRRREALGLDGRPHDDFADVDRVWLGDGVGDGLRDRLR